MLCSSVAGKLSFSASLKPAIQLSTENNEYDKCQYEEKHAPQHISRVAWFMVWVLVVARPFFHSHTAIIQAVGVANVGRPTRRNSQSRRVSITAGVVSWPFRTDPLSWPSPRRTSEKPGTPGSSSLLSEADLPLRD